MMRVLMVRRQDRGGIATYSNHLVEGLEKLGVDVVIDDMAGRIPEETGYWVDRKVSPILKSAVKGFDLVHAWGFRSAWACAEAFYIRFPWVYTAYDFTRTKNSLLIDRLNHAKAGICTSRAAREELDSVDALHLSVIAPALSRTPEELDRTTARDALGLPVSGFVVVCIAGPREDRGAENFVQALAECPMAHGVLVSQHVPQHQARLSHFFEADIPLVMAASNLVVVPGLRQSFSMVALEAMHAGRPVAMRTGTGMDEIGVPGIHYHGFATDDDLVDLITAASHDEMDLRATVEPARMRAQDWFGMEECARRHYDLYRQVLGLA